MDDIVIGYGSSGNEGGDLGVDVESKQTSRAHKWCRYRGCPGSLS